MVFAYTYFEQKLDGPAWQTRLVLRLVEAPVLWAVDGAIAANIVPSLPLEYTFNSALYSSTVSMIGLYSMFGGTFYGLVAAAIVLIRSRTRRGPTLPPRED